MLYSYLELDLAGNIYLSGGFSETADFDPGPGTLNLTSNGGSGGLITKYDNNGNIIYAKNIRVVVDMIMLLPLQLMQPEAFISAESSLLLQTLIRMSQ